MAISNTPYVPPPTKNPPDLKKDFYKARRPEFPPDAGMGPVSKIQIEKLKAAPAEKPVKTKSPVVADNLEPKNMSRVKVPAATPPPTRAEQITFMESRLKQHKGIAKDRFQRVARPAPKREP